MLIALNSDAIALPMFPMISIPKLLLYLIGNTLTQYICISAVFILTTECASLTVTLVVTLSKVGRRDTYIPNKYNIIFHTSTTE